jgi:hypothetical protein
MGKTEYFAPPGWEWYPRDLLRTFVVYSAITVKPLVPSFYSQDLMQVFQGQTIALEVTRCNQPE